MERQRKAPPAVYTPTRGDPSTLQNLPGSYQPPQPSVRIATNHTTQPAVPKSSYTSSPYGVPFKPEHNSNAGDVPVRAASQRRGDGDGREQRSMDYGSPHEALPPAPDVPRAAPPISYRERYTNGAPPAPPQGSSRSFSARARALQMEANSPPMRRPSDEATSPVEQQAARPRRRSVSDSAAVSYPKTQPGVPASYSPSSTSAAIPRQRMGSTSSKQDGATTSPLSRSNTRMESGIQEGTGELSRNWASDRSPLQKLEVKLSDISKEEKRARVEEAEQLLRESMAARGERIPSNGIAQPRRVSGPAPNRSAEPDHRQQRSSSLQKTPTRRDTERSTGTRDQLSSQRQPQPDSPARRNNGDTLFKDSGRSVKFRDQQREVNHIDSQTRSDERQTGQTSQSNDRTARNGPGTSSGNGTPELMDRSSSRKFQQQQQPRVQQSTTNNTPSKEVPQGQQQLYINRFGSSRGDKSAADDSGIPDPVPVQAVQNTRGDVPRYAVPPQTAGGHQARQQVGFENAKNEAARVVPERKHHVPNLLHHGQRGPSLPLETPRVAPRRFDEWRKAKIARLTAADFSANTNSVTPNKAWWEQSGRDRQNQTRGSKAQDVGYDEELGPTSFQPLLYLKCGPLLRYTGLKKERVSRSSSRGGSQITQREVWRGSVMIVTVDADSNYDAAPTLRLFSQPMELAPPPPQQLDDEGGQQLAPEHVDPIAGLPKISRTGKTLYVKPVEYLAEGVDFSRIEDNGGLFEEFPGPANIDGAAQSTPLEDTKTLPVKPRRKGPNGEKMGKFREVEGIRLHREKGVTFWRFSLEVELTATQNCVAYRINKGPAINFWVPAQGQTMNIMFHSCNGFSLSVNPNDFSGPDPLWRDVLGTHQTRPFHVMIGGGDQIYNDAVTQQTTLFRDWLGVKNPHHKHTAPFSDEMREELERFYLERYSMWFSQGLFGMANSQIPMINIWDDHDIIDGFGSYPHHFMSSPVFTGLGAVAFKYYMLFQHQSVPDEIQADEPSWLLGAAPGPYVNELSRSVFMSLGSKVAFLGLDCRTERMRDEIFSQQTYDAIFDRCRQEILEGETKHLIVLLGVPIAYPRLVWLENVLTSRLMDPVKALGRAGMFGGFLNQFDGGVEILDDLDDHWTAKNHKAERNWFIEELQGLAAEKSVRITILGGDVHLAAVGQFYSNPKLKIPKDRDHRYMPNIISSAIVNTPPPELLGDILNKRNRVHHFDKETDEDMIPIFTHDVDGKPRNNKRLLPRRNWCSIREYNPGSTPPPTPPTPPQLTPELQQQRPGKLQRTLSLTRRDVLPGNLLRRLSQRGGPSDTAVPAQQKQGPMVISAPLLGSSDGYFPPQPQPHPQSPQEQHTIPTTNGSGAGPTPRPGGFHRRPTNLSEKVAKKGGADEGDPSGHINLEGGLDIVINCEVSQKDPSGITVPYRLLVPALFYEGEGDLNMTHLKRGTWLSRLGSKSQKRTKLADRQGQGEWGGESSDSEGQLGRQDSEQHESPQSGPYGQGGGYSGVEAYKAKGRRKWF